MVSRLLDKLFILKTSIPLPLEMYPCLADFDDLLIG
jgi:hypothetical protein